MVGGVLAGGNAAAAPPLRPAAHTDRRSGTVLRSAVGPELAGPPRAVS